MLENDKSADLEIILKLVRTGCENVHELNAVSMRVLMSLRFSLKPLKIKSRIFLFPYKVI